MKSCPRCQRTYPDNEVFCEADGTALVSAGPAFTRKSEPEGSIECPSCGGRAEPGEVICNFCGTRLIPEETAPPPPPRQSSLPRTEPARPSGRLASGSPMETGGLLPEEDNGEGRSPLSILMYVLAAVVALIAGAWLALRISSKPTPEVTVASPSAAATPIAAPVAASGPIVALAGSIPLQVTGESASAPERNTDAARKIFDDRKSQLVDAYGHVLASDSRANDAMMVRIRILPDGTVTSGEVRASTSPNPSLDAEVVGAMMGAKFAPFSGGAVEADYPVIFAHDNAEQLALESNLKNKLASLSPTEAAEYATAASPSTAASPAPPVAAAPSPAAAPGEAAPPVVVAKPKPKPRPKATPRPPSLLELVKERLRSSPKLRRVNAYTSDGGVVTLFGKVFDDNDKAFAERTVRSIPGVNQVIDTLTTDTAQWAEEQDRITRQLQNAGLDKVTVKVIGADAFLNGTVKTELEKTRAVTIAESAAPVTVRTNLIRVEPGNMFGF